MKERNCFVSNSSVSSFLVIVRDVIKGKKKNEMDFTYSEIDLFIDSYLKDCGEDVGILRDKNDIFERLFGYGNEDGRKSKLEEKYSKLKDGERILLIDFNMHTPIVKELIRNCRDMEVLESWGD
jgi:hypothetical protein